MEKRCQKATWIFLLSLTEAANQSLCSPTQDKTNIFMTTKRIETIDIMKGLGIIMVMLGHQDLPVSHLIYSFHMPLFFIIGGYLYKEKSVSLSLKNDFRRLVIPYVFASSLIIGNEMLMSVAKNDSKYVYEALIASIYGSGHSYHGALFSEIPSIGAIWFLMALFWTKNIFNILNTFLNNKCLFITCIVLSFAASYIDKYVINMPFDILPGLSAIIFYYIGFFLKDYVVRWYTIIFLVLMWGVAVNYSHLYMVRCDFGCYPIDILGACGGTVIIYFVSKYIHCISKLSYMLSWLGVNSLAILCFHSYKINHSIWQIMGVSNPYIVIFIKMLFPILLTLLCCHIKVIRNLLNIKTI